MRKDWTHLEGDRLRRAAPPYVSNTGDDFGAFAFLLPSGVTLMVIATTGDPAAEDDTGNWEHTSVHARQPKLDGTVESRVPTWEEMCHVKALFWEPNECVVQYHPPQENYINMHNAVLHLWKPIKKEIPMPPTICV